MSTAKIVLCFTLILFQGLSAPARTWKLRTGSSIDAEFVSQDKGIVTLKKADGGEAKVPRIRLSRKDQAYIKGLKNMKPGEKAPAPKMKDGAPSIEKGFVGRPHFDTKGGNFSAGTAFIVRIEGEASPVILTCKHLFGAAGGLKKEVPHAALPKFVKRVSLNDFMPGHTTRSKVKAALVKSVNPGMPAPDLAIFRTSLSPRDASARLAPANPAAGEAAWLVADLVGQGRGKYLHAGTVAGVNGEHILFKFNGVTPDTRGASGAPYINAKGEVIGLHLGSMRDDVNMTGMLSVETISKAVVQTRPAAK